MTKAINFQMVSRTLLNQAKFGTWEMKPSEPYRLKQHILAGESRTWKVWHRDGFAMASGVILFVEAPRGIVEAGLCVVACHEATDPCSK